MTIQKPIFVIGAGRSGSTEFHSILSHHPHVAWLTDLARRHPDRPHLGRLAMTALDLPVIGKFLDRRLFRGEFYDFWDYYFPGFRASFRDLMAGDATLKLKRAVPEAFSQILTPRRSRLLVKITGWPRLGFLHEIFPDARFVHIKRDGRAVANSSLSVDFWRGWAGPDNWGWGGLSPEHAAEWERHDRSFVALAAIQWKIFMDAVDRARALVPADSFLELTYEEMCDEPVSTFRRIAGFAELEWLPVFENTVRTRVLNSANNKWRRELTAEQQRILEGVLRDRLLRSGYALDEPGPSAPAGARPSRAEMELGARAPARGMG
jgi:hypothetical protein